MAISEPEIVRKLAWRLMPLLILCYFVAILDRANVGVAALTMNHDLGLSAADFGLAAGIFFVPYVLLEVPSNLILARVGARIWIARIMFTWGLFAAAHAFIWNAHGLYVVRALLGAAEAGFVPGVIFYLSLWFPAVYRGLPSSRRASSVRHSRGAGDRYADFQPAAGTGRTGRAERLAMDVSG